MICARRHKILILDNSFGMGGVEKKLFDLIPRFDPEHFEMIICCLKEGGYFKEPLKRMGLRFYDGLLRHKYDVLGYTRLIKIIREEKIELIYSFLHPNTVLFSFLARVTGRVQAWVISVHATGSLTGGRLVKPYLKPFLGRVDRFIAVAQVHKDYLVNVEGLPQGNIVVIHNGVDVDTYHPGEANPELRQSLGLKAGSAVVTTIASLKPAKCVDVLLEAAWRVAQQADNTEFLIVGDGPERKNLERLAHKLGLDEKVMFTGVRDDVYDLLRLSSLCVLPSRTEAFPNVVLEAMATGIPVVSTDVGSVREMVEDGVSARLVPPEDPHALAGAIAEMLLHPETGKAFGERGRSIVLERFTLDSMRSSREALFAELLCTAG